MTNLATLLGKPVNDAEIEAASASVGLTPRAFHGRAGDDPRLKVLRSNGSIDVVACPGSGKTTLLVAKLAILAGRWTLPTTGVCVLSHTNVARIEIEKRLGAYPAGRAILSYPHFVGTIHAFVNQFIALPWLRSQGIDVVAIDNEICLQRRWSKLKHKQRKAVERTGRGKELLKIVDARHDLGEINWAKGRLGKRKDMYRAFVSACSATTQEGYFCHDDMMIWAAKALDENPEILTVVRRRFPVLFLDEVQDNSEEQSLIIRRVFTEGQGASLRQRFGDMNQAIYGRANETSGAHSDSFPDPAITIAVPNSHRFGSQIATLANPLAIDPPGLIGLREHHEDDRGKQAAILLFDAAEPISVLPAFADFLINRFSALECTNAAFAAVGAIHRDTGRNNTPNCVAHYWHGYDQDLSRTAERPATFLGYLRRGIAEAGLSGDLRPIVEWTADGLIRLASLLNLSVRYPTHANRHRQFLRLVEHDPATVRRYETLCWKLASGELPADSTAWQPWKKPAAEIAEVLLGGAAAHEAETFLTWQDELTVDGVATRHGNIFLFPSAAPAVRVKVGSIHSVKGETHLATLVLDTHYKGSHFARIKDWLTGEKAGISSTSKKVELEKSLKQHYVAVTRPSHLLCLAMRRDALSEAELGMMRARNWMIGDIVEKRIAWRA